MSNDNNQLVNQTVFRILEKVHGQQDLNTLFAVIRDIVHELIEKCQQRDVYDGKFPTELISQIDHELRTPMSGILGFAELLTEELEDADQRRKAEHILESARRLMEMLDLKLESYGITRHTMPAQQTLDSGNPETSEAEQEIADSGENSAAGERKSRKSMGRKLPDVLIVEDNLVNIQLLMIYLRRYCNIFSVRDADAAIRLCEKQQFDAILMDIHLGAGKTGTEAMQEIRKLPGNEQIPVIAVTGYANHGDRERFLSAGFNDYIKKPVEREVIREVMNRLFGKNK